MFLKCMQPWHRPHTPDPPGPQLHAAPLYGGNSVEPQQALDITPILLHIWLMPMSEERLLQFFEIFNSLFCCTFSFLLYFYVILTF